MMKKLFTFFFLLTFSVNLFADIAVKSFRKLDTDLDARLNEPMKDQNGDLCAIIKVVTTQTGFSFDCGQIGIVKTVQKPSEIWVYVPYGAKRITISHPQLGIFRDYQFTIPIEKATVYEMVVLSGKVETIVIDEITSQWLVITPEPADAMVYLNDQFVKNGIYQAKHKPGSYTYRIEAPLYHNEAGKIELSDTKKEVSVKLRPAFGYISVNSEPEQGARITIDGNQLEKKTPCQTDPLPSGEHTVQIVKEMYQPVTQKVTVNDGLTSPINIMLKPNFAEVSITAPTDATIYINNQQKSAGSWQGRLSAGVYSLEAHQEKHRDAKQDIELVIGEKRNIELHPSPIYGSLDVITSPPGGTILIGGKEFGMTPNTINNLLIGDYSIEINKTGYNTINKTVSVTDGKTTELNETFSVGKRITINSTPTGAFLFIDDEIVGQTPFQDHLSIGKHILRVENDNKMAEKTIEIMQNGGESIFTLLIGSSSPLSDNSNTTKTQTDKSKIKLDNIYDTPIDNTNSEYHKKKQERPLKTTKRYFGFGLGLPLIESASGDLSKDLVSEITFGVVKTVGIYGKLKFSPENSDIKVDYTINNLPNDLYYESTSSDKLFSRFGAIGGLMLNLRPITFYAGAGWGHSNHYINADLYRYADDNFSKSIKLGDKNSFEGIEGDAGIIFNIGKFGLSASIGSIEFKYYEVSAGIGYLF